MRPVSLRGRAAFERLLRARPLARSTHFAAHHVAAGDAFSVGRIEGARTTDLSTEQEQNLSRSVDKSVGEVGLGCVIPKRLARRAVTRNLFRREIVRALTGRWERLPAGLWLVRQRQAWSKADWRSAASEPLRQAVRDELAELLDACAIRAAQAGSRLGS